MGACYPACSSLEVNNVSLIDLVACVQEIKSFLRSPYSVGIIGGRPQHAIYFVGYKGDELLGLDPHTVFKNPPPDPSDAALSATHQAAFADYISQVLASRPMML